MVPVWPAPRQGVTHQDVAFPLSELSEGLRDLLPRFGLLEVPVHGAIFFLRRRRTPAQEGSAESPWGCRGAHPPGSWRKPGACTVTG